MRTCNSTYNKCLEENSFKHIIISHALTNIRMSQGLKYKKTRIKRLKMMQVWWYDNYRYYCWVRQVFVLLRLPCVPYNHLLTQGISSLLLCRMKCGIWHTPQTFESNACRVCQTWHTILLQKILIRKKKCNLFLVVILIVMSRVGDNKHIDALNIYLYITTQKSQLI